MTVRSSLHARHLMWGTAAVRVFTDRRRLGLDLRRRRALERPSVSAGMFPFLGEIASPTCSLSPWGLPVCMARPRPGAASGAGLADGSRLPVSVGPLRQADQDLGASSRPTPSSSEPQTNGVAEWFESHAEGTDHPWSHLPLHRRAAGRRPRLGRTLQCPVDRRKERLPEPRIKLVSRGIPRSQSGSPRETNSVILQEPGALQQVRTLSDHCTLFPLVRHGSG